MGASDQVAKNRGYCGPNTGVEGGLESNSAILYLCAIDSKWLDRCLFYSGAFNATLVSRPADSADG